MLVDGYTEMRGKLQTYAGDRLPGGIYWDP